jgi:uncharacterized GH25 family protein
MKFTKGLISSLALLAALGPVSAVAHSQWLLPSATQVENSTNPQRPTYVTVDAASSNGLFYADHNAMRLTGLQITGPDGAAVEPENVSTGKLRSTFDVKLLKPGTYRIASVNNSVMARYKKDGQDVNFRGTEETFAKDVPANAEGLTVSRNFGRVETFVTSGAPTDIKAIGKGLEILPLQPTTDLVLGESAKFRVLVDGKPTSGLSIKIVPGGVRYRGALKDQVLKTDANGEFSIKWELAGAYWVNTSYPPRPEADDDDAPAGGPAAGGQGGGMGAPRGPMAPLRMSYSVTLEVMPQ